MKRPTRSNDLGWVFPNISFRGPSQEVLQGHEQLAYQAAAQRYDRMEDLDPDPDVRAATIREWVSHELQQLGSMAWRRQDHRLSSPEPDALLASAAVTSTFRSWVAKKHDALFPMRGLDGMISLYAAMREAGLEGPCDQQGEPDELIELSEREVESLEMDCRSLLERVMDQAQPIFSLYSKGVREVGEDELEGEFQSKLTWQVGAYPQAATQARDRIEGLRRKIATSRSRLVWIADEYGQFPDAETGEPAWIYTIKEIKPKQLDSLLSRISDADLEELDYGSEGGLKVTIASDDAPELEVVFLPGDITALVARQATPGQWHAKHYIDHLHPVEGENES